jgi:hypothetical protein
MPKFPNPNSIKRTGWFMSHTVTLKPVFSAMIAIVGPPTYPAPMQQIEPLNAMLAVFAT